MPWNLNRPLVIHPNETNGAVVASDHDQLAEKPFEDVKESKEEADAESHKMAVDLPVKDEAKWVPETGGESLKKLDADRLAMDVEPSDTLLKMLAQNR